MEIEIESSTILAQALVHQHAMACALSPLPLTPPGRIQQLFRDQHFSLLERAAEAIAALVLKDFGAPWVRVSIAKLSALPGVKRLGVVIERGSRK